MLLGELYWLRDQGKPAGSFMSKVADKLEVVEAQSRPLKRARVDEPVCLPASSSSQCTLPASSTAALFEQLSRLIEWRSAGHLTESEFESAKRQLQL